MYDILQGSFFDMNSHGQKMEEMQQNAKFLDHLNWGEISKHWENNKGNMFAGKDALYLFICKSISSENLLKYWICHRWFIMVIRLLRKQTVFLYSLLISLLRPSISYVQGSLSGCKYGIQNKYNKIWNINLTELCVYNYYY